MVEGIKKENGGLAGKNTETAEALNLASIPKASPVVQVIAVQCVYYSCIH